MDTAVPLDLEAPRPRRIRRLGWAALVFVLAVLGFLRYIGVIGGNLREVVPGQLFRSAQLSAARLGAVIDADQIRTVINLRNGSPTRADAVAEREECSHRGVAYVSIPMSAVVLPPPERLTQLLDTFDHASFPVLFHCEGGSDRSGLTGTIYLNVYQHVPLDEAEARQLTWRYAHFSWGQAHAMDDFFDLYRKTAGGLSLRQWIETRYPALYAGRDATPATPSSGATAAAR